MNDGFYDEMRRAIQSIPERETLTMYVYILSHKKCRVDDLMKEFGNNVNEHMRMLIDKSFIQMEPDGTIRSKFVLN